MQGVFDPEIAVGHDTYPKTGCWRTSDVRSLGEGLGDRSGRLRRRPVGPRHLVSVLPAGLELGAATAATYEVHDSCLRLSIATDAPLWCPDQHPTPMRVSGIASGSRSGAVGSTEGQQRFLTGRGFASSSRISKGGSRRGARRVRCRMEVSPRSMAAVWLSGFEEQPGDAGELCLVKCSAGTSRPTQLKSASALSGSTTRVSSTSSSRRDSRSTSGLQSTWSSGTSTAPVSSTTYGCRPSRLHLVPDASMIAVFDFPDWSTGNDDQFVPAIEVDSITGT